MQQRHRWTARLASLTLAALLALAAGCGSSQQPAAPAAPAAVKPQTTPGQAPAPVKPQAPASSAQVQPKKGGTLRVTIQEEPQSLDMPSTTRTAARIVSWHMFETLLTYDEKFGVAPLLAESFDVSADGKTYTFKLRQGIKFHNGKEMTAEDVHASIARWGQISGFGKNTFKDVESWTVKDKYTVEMKLKVPNNVLLTLLAETRGGAAIIPKEIAEAAGTKRTTEFIGTGPFKLAEHIPDRHVKAVRFDDYKPLPGEPNGYGGRREALVDEIFFIPTPDPSVRMAGLQAGDFHFADRLNPDEYDRLSKVDGITLIVAGPQGFAVQVFNKKMGVMTSRPLREAWNIALDIDEIALGVYGNENFYRVDCSQMWLETAWHTNAGCEGKYNAKDTVRAKALLQEAGYKGEPVRWIVAPTGVDYKYALLIQQQLEKIGFKIDIMPTEGAALAERRDIPEVYDVFTTNNSYRPHPTLHNSLDDNWAGWWTLPAKNELRTKMLAASDQATAFKHWEEIHKLYYTDFPVAKMVENYDLDAIRNVVKDYVRAPQAYFWNVWLDN